MKKHFKRSTKEKVLGGVCGGVGEYFEIDPVLIRIVWIIIVLGTGFFPGMLVYLILWFVTPEE